MVRRVRSHDLDKRLEALGYRLIRVDPREYATWAIIPTRKRVHLGVPNLDSVQSIAERMEEELWLEFGQWLNAQPAKNLPSAMVNELGYAEQFLSVVKGLTGEGAAAIVRRWYEPTE